MKLYVDYETYYTDEYSLRKMPTVNYLKDPRFEVTGAAVAIDDGPSLWIWGDQLGSVFARARAIAKSRGEPIQQISHNIQFDGAISAWHYGFVPDLFIDTLGMARALLSHRLRRLSLDAVANHLGIGVKGTVLSNYKGWTRKMLQGNPAAAGPYKAYALNDNDLCRGIFKHLAPQMPRGEMLAMDTVTRMFVCPQLALDNGVMIPHLARVKQQKEELLSKIGLQDNEILMSNDKFAAELMSYGVEPPTKISATTGKETWAFAKNDAGLKELAEHDDPQVQALVAARLGHKSTLEETRTEKFIKIGTLYHTWPNREAMMPVPLRFSGAHTHRLSGADGLNMQNLPRLNPKDPTSGALRRALKAPKGYVIVSIDLSQIEARVVCWLAGASKMLEVFATGGDPYTYMAHSIGSQSRQLGKGLVLGCGFGMGAPKFRVTVRAAPYNLVLSETESQDAVMGYRREVPEVPLFWKALQNAANYTARRIGQSGPYRQMMKHTIPQNDITFEVRDECVFIELPSGLHLKYQDLRLEKDGLWFEYSGIRKYTYGGKLCENYVQAFARCIIWDAAVAIRKQTGFSPALQVHDENVFVVPEHHADAFRKEAEAITIVRPRYALDLPIACESGMGHTYGSAH